MRREAGAIAGEGPVMLADDPINDGRGSVAEGTATDGGAIVARLKSSRTVMKGLYDNRGSGPCC
jgi:hypothetical protein